MVGVGVGDECGDVIDQHANAEFSETLQLQLAACLVYMWLHVCQLTQFADIQVANELTQKRLACRQLIAAVCTQQGPDADLYFVRTKFYNLHWHWRQQQCSRRTLCRRLQSTCIHARAVTHLGGFSFASAGRTLRSPTQVQMDGTHEGAVAAVSQGRHHQASAVPQVLIPILHLSIHHAHWDAQVLRVIVEILAAAHTVRQCKHSRVNICS